VMTLDPDESLGEGTLLESFPSSLNSSFPERRICFTEYINPSLILKLKSEDELLRIKIPLMVMSCLVIVACCFMMKLANRKRDRILSPQGWYYQETYCIISLH